MIEDAAGLRTLDTDSATMVSGQFAAGHMTYEYDRSPATTEPYLSEMTAAPRVVPASGSLMLISIGVMSMAWLRARRVREPAAFRGPPEQP